VTLLLGLLGSASADEPIVLRQRFEGPVSFSLSGTSLADDTDANGRVDALALPATWSIDPGDVPSAGTLDGALLYWGGTQTEPGSGPCTGAGDDTVTLTPPTGSPVTVTGDRCDCADGDAASYDVWTCRADLSTELASLDGASAIGTWSVDGYTGLVADGTTDHAVAGLVMVHRDPALPSQTVAVYDGLQTVFQDTIALQLAGFEADASATGDLAWMVLEGDPGGSPDEFVEVTAQPSGTTGLLSDPDNPADDPMNRTIGVAGLTDVVGAALDRFGLGGLLAPQDDTLDVVISADNDKFWPVAVVVGVETYEPDLSASTFVWSLQVDGNADGQVGPGDTVRFTLLLDNDGDEPATTDVVNALPGEIASWLVVDDGGGIDVSSPTTLQLQDVEVPAGSTTTVIVDAVVDDVPDMTVFTNTATWSAPDEGGQGGSATTASIEVWRDGDDEGWYDREDGCPDVFDPLQTDTDGDGINDACDTCPEVAGGGSGPDSDGDTIPDECDQCPTFDDRLDADGDTVPDACDVCPTFDDRLDADGDGVPDDCDVCPTGDDTADSDADGTPDACDLCEGFNDDDDDDGDDVPDGCDECPGNDNLDNDGDGIPDACDICALGDDALDDDGDTVPDACDQCPAGDDSADADGDGVADACDVCDGGDDSDDIDGDTVPDSCDLCAIGDDRLDADRDDVPDECDVCPGGDDAIDTDGDGTPDACDECDGVDDTGDADGDGVPDGCDLCDGYDDRLDADGDTIPDACDVCDGFDDRVDSDSDKAPDACDVCPFTADPGQLDADADGAGDACDPCPMTAFQTDTDLDGTFSCVDCDDTDPDLNADDLDGDGYSSCDGDCIDDDDRVFPGAGETPDGADEDCDGEVDETTSRYDDDGDGFTELGGDCDDADPSVNPGAVEVCDGVDEDCDGIADEQTECYDDDGDGFCEDTSCTDGSLPNDCNDDAITTHPAATEIQGNGIDDDCDGEVDDAVADQDGDGVSVDGGDCDDEDASVGPGAPEVPDDIDNDCDGLIDEGTVRGDDDGDGWTEVEGDCHDGDVTIHPGADEPEDGIDNDCNGIVDDGAVGTDDDGDGFADAAGDCDDDDPQVFPGADESDNGRDDDCDGAVDEDFEDVDGDGVSFADGDCDDLEGWVNPGAAEVCDGMDNDCDGQADEEGCNDGSADAQVTTPDDDTGGCSTVGGSAPLGGLLVALLAVARRRATWLPMAAAAAASAGCGTETSFQGIQPRLAVSPQALLDFGDVPAGQAVTLPVVVEHLEGADIELQQIVLVDLSGAFTYEGPEETLLPSGGQVQLPLRFQAAEPGWHTAVLDITHGGLSDQVSVDLRGHAAPSDAEVYPLGLDYGLVDVGDGPVREVTVVNRGSESLQIDEVSTSSARFEVDLSMPRTLLPGDQLQVPVVFRPTTIDPAGGELVVRAGEAVLGRVALWGNDCEGGLISAYDADNDGFSGCSTDCDDSDPGAYPGALEKVDGVDNDCDDEIDEDTEATDDDGDGYCEDPFGCIDGTEPGDCNDADDTIGPHAEEILDNGRDDDCDGRVDFGIDDDDGDGVAVSGGDCDDADPTVWPGAVEEADGVDDDCDGLIDEGTTAMDDDGDGWCEGPVCTDGSSPGDCHDDDDTVYPDAPELADWLDNDCDHSVDEDTVNSDDDGDGYTEQGGDCDDDDSQLSPGLGTC